MGGNNSKPKPLPPPEYTLTPPLFKRKRIIRLLECDEYEQIGLSARGLLSDHFASNGKINFSMFMQPDEGVECSARLEKGDAGVGGDGVVRVHNGPFVLEGEINTNVGTDLLAAYSNNGTTYAVGVARNSPKMFGSMYVKTALTGNLRSTTSAIVEYDERAADQTYSLANSTVFNYRNWKLGFKVKQNVSDNLTSLLDAKIAYASGSASVSDMIPDYEIAVNLFDRMRAVSISYFQHMVVPRKIKNPMEASNVKTIINYIDLGVTVSQRLEANDDSVELAAAGSWQINKNNIFKAKISTAGATLLYGFKSWWLPSIELCVSTSIDFRTGRSRNGLSIVLENFGSVDYHRPQHNVKIPNYLYEKTK